MFQNPELKLDKEFEDLMFTDIDCTPLNVPFIVKKIKRDYKGNKIQCTSCNNGVSGVIEGSHDCPYCEALGFQWTEHIHRGWFYKQSYMTDRSISASVPLSMAQAEFFKYFLAYDKSYELNTGDVILIPELDSNGNPVIPIKKKGLYKVTNSDSNASNQTKTEFNIATLTTTNGNVFRGLLNG